MHELIRVHAQETQDLVAAPRRCRAGGCRWTLAFQGVPDLRQQPGLGRRLTVRQRLTRSCPPDAPPSRGGPGGPAPGRTPRRFLVAWAGITRSATAGRETAGPSRALALRTSGRRQASGSGSGESNGVLAATTG